MRLSELTNEMLSTYKYPNLMAEVKESTYSICTIAEHIGLGRYRKEDDSKVWSKLTGREEILYDEALGLARLFDTKIEYLFSHELNIIDGQTAAYWRWFDFHQEAQRESEIFKARSEIMNELKAKPYLLKLMKELVTLNRDQLQEFIDLTKKDKREPQQVQTVIHVILGLLVGFDMDVIGLGDRDAEQWMEKMLKDFPVLQKENIVNE